MSISSVRVIGSDSIGIRVNEKNVGVKGCDIVSTTSHGIEVEGSGCSIDGCHILDCNDAGINVVSGVAEIGECVVADNTEDGLVLADSANVTACEFSGNGQYGIDATGQEINVGECHFSSNTNGAVQTDGSTVLSSVSNIGLGDSNVSADNVGDGLKTSGGDIVVEPADFAGTFLSDDGSDNLQVDTDEGLEDDGAGNIRVKEPFSYSPGMVIWESGLSDKEVGRIVLQAGETLVVERIEFRQDGGGTSANASIDVHDATTATTIGTQTLGGTTKDPGSSGTGNTVVIRLSNSTGSDINAAPRVVGFIGGT